jgi:riboflavin synthase
MFNGIIEVVGEVVSLHQGKLVIDAGRFAAKLKPGDSIAVDGVCLTAVSKNGKKVNIDLSPETLTRTNLGHRSRGDRVNLELPIKGSTMISGHFVQGHVEGVGKTHSWKRSSDDVRLRIKASRKLLESCITKGSIALNGVSLTIASARDDLIEVALIPYTLEHTNLGQLKVGDPVNIETDILGRYVVSILKNTYDRKRFRRSSSSESLRPGSAKRGDTHAKK